MLLVGKEWTRITECYPLFSVAVLGGQQDCFTYGHAQYTE